MRITTMMQAISQMRSTTTKRCVWGAVHFIIAQSSAALLVAGLAGAQTTGTVMPTPKFTAFDDSGNPISGAKLCVYVAGTTTPATTFSDVALAVPNSNPVVADSAGRMTVFLAPGTSYKFVLRQAGSDATCATGSIVYTQDNVLGTPSTASNLDVLGTAGEAVLAGQVVYLSDGSGGKTPGQWYLASTANAYSSTTPILGVAPSAISSATAGTIRVGGTITGLTSVTPGSTYYVSGTPGAITTAGAGSRRVGVADTATSLVFAANPPLSTVTDVLGLAGETLTSGSAVYLSDGSGAKTAGSWYLATNANSYSSTQPVVGVAPSTITSGQSGTVRLGGQVTGLTSLTAGASYYVGTGGALTATMPTAGNLRRVGMADTTTSLVIDANPAPTPVQGFTSVSTTSTGTVNDFAPGLLGDTLLRCNNATALTITGFAAGYDGQRLVVVSVGAGQVNLSHQAAGSAAGNRLINTVTSSTTPLAAGTGRAEYVYDAATARWRLVSHEQGAFITYTPALTNLVQGNGTLSARYYLRGTEVRVDISISFGTTSTYGAGGSFTFSVPYAASGLSNVHPTVASGFHSGTGLSAGIWALSNGATTFTVNRTTDVESASGWNNSTPWVWASGDAINLSGVYATN